MNVNNKIQLQYFSQNVCVCWPPILCSALEAEGEKKSRQESVKNKKREIDDNDNNSNIIPWNLPVKTFYMHTSLSFSSFFVQFSFIYFLV